VTFITGHSEKNINVPGSGTLVYYMGASNLRVIAGEAIRKGWSSNTPVLLVYNVSGKDQEEYYTTLQRIIDEDRTYKTPLIIIIGDVVNLKHNPSENIRKKVFLTTGTHAGDVGNIGEVIHTPLIEIRPLTDYKHLTHVMEELQTFQWLIFTSRYAVLYFFQALQQHGKDSRWLAGLNIASMGNKTTAELNKYGIYPDLQPENESSEGLVELFRRNGITKQHILIPRSNIALSVLPEGLSNINNQVTTAVIYENVIPDNVAKVDLEGIDVIVFASPSCVENFFKVYGYPILDKQKFMVRGGETLKKLLSYPVNPAQIIRKKVYETIS
jgi:uroporphyrinogen III methyltransferase/synthase